MAGKYSLLTVLSLQASGFNSGLDKAKQKTKDFANGVQSATNSVKGQFAGLTKGITQNFTGGLNPALDGGLSSIRGLIGGVSSLKTALIASGVGAIILGIGTAFYSLNSYMTNTKEGAERSKEAFAVVKGATIELQNRINTLGKSIFELFAGNLGQAGKDLASVFDGNFISNMLVEGAAAQVLAEDMNKLKREKLALDNEELDVALKESDLKKKAKDVTKESNYSAEQRLQFAKEAVRITDEFEAKKITYLEKEFKYIKDLNSRKKFLTDADLQAELTAKKALADYRIKDNQDAISENKVIAKTQKEIDADALEAIKERIQLEKQYAVERIKSVTLSGNYKAKGKKELQPQLAISKEDINKLFETDKLTTFENFITGAGLKLQSFKVDTLGMLNDMNSNVLYGINNLGSSIADSFANMITGEEGSGFNQLFSGILSTVGEFISQMGAAVMAYAVTMEAFKKAFVNPIAAITAGLGLMIMGGVVSNLANSMNSKGFANGGIVGGSSFSGDNVVAHVNSGEMILNKNQQSTLFAMASGSGSFGGGEVLIKFENGSLQGYMNYQNKKIRNTR